MRIVEAPFMEMMIDGGKTVSVEGCILVVARWKVFDKWLKSSSYSDWLVIEDAAMSGSFNRYDVVIVNSKDNQVHQKELIRELYKRGKFVADDPNEALKEVL